MRPFLRQLGSLGEGKLVKPFRPGVIRRVYPLFGPLRLRCRGLPTLARQRADFDKSLPLPADVSCRPVMVGRVPAEWVWTPEADRGVLLYLHGGGYLIGSIASHRELSARLGRAARGRVFLLDYRLAPEDPFPAAVEDAIAAYRFLTAAGIAPSQIAIAGDSAGGGLALATLLALRPAGDPLPAAVVTLSAWTDLALTGASLNCPTPHDRFITRAGLQAAALAYLAGEDARHPLASPLYGDFAGFPPLFLQVSADELLADDSRRVAAKAHSAGVEVFLDEVPRRAHVFQRFPDGDPTVSQAIERIGRFLHTTWGT